MVEILHKEVSTERQYATYRAILRAANGLTFKIDICHKTHAIIWVWSKDSQTWNEVYSILNPEVNKVVNYMSIRDEKPFLEDKNELLKVAALILGL